MSLRSADLLFRYGSTNWVRRASCKSLRFANFMGSLFIGGEGFVIVYGKTGSLLSSSSSFLKFLILKQVLIIPIDRCQSLSLCDIS